MLKSAQVIQIVLFQITARVEDIPLHGSVTLPSLGELNERRHKRS